MLLPYLNENLIEAGCDEAGRGCLAGSVYAAAVILPKDFKNELLNDSNCRDAAADRWGLLLPIPAEAERIRIKFGSFLVFEEAVGRIAQINSDIAITCLC